MMKNIDLNMNDKIVLITGANSGIGKKTAMQLAKMGANVILLCRNKERGEEAVQDLFEKPGSLS